MFSAIDLNIIGADFSYQRTSNFAVKPLEEKLRARYGERAKHLYLTSSGMEAATSLIEYLLPKTGKVVIHKNLYTESRLWLRLIDRYEVVAVDMKDLDAVERAAKGAGIVLLDNPSVFQEWFDVRAIAKIAHTAGAKLVVDNSILSFALYNPLNDGADLVVESYSKYVSGHGDLMAGAIVFGYEPDNLARLEAFLSWRGRVVCPMTAYMLEARLETLEIRLAKQQATAMCFAEKLRKRKEKVLYCGSGGVLLLLGRNNETAKNLTMFVTSATYGTTYSTCSPSYRPDLYEGYGDYLRLSCGLEDKTKLWADIEKALKKGRKKRG